MSDWNGNPSDDRIRDLLVRARRIAVVGVSHRSYRPSYGVARYLTHQGYEVLPVNPNLTEWEGRPVYASLRYLPGQVDIVDVFRRPEFVDELLPDLAATGAKTLWLQEGVVNRPAAVRAAASGIEVIMDRCILKEHARLLTR